MKKMIKLSILCILVLPAMLQAQIGSKLKSVVDYAGAKNILKTEIQGAYIMQDIQTAANELTTVIYTKDSMAVAISLQRTDSFFTVDEIEQYLQSNTPSYKPNIKAMVDQVTYHKDTTHQIALILRYEVQGEGLVISNFVLCTDKAMIQYWTRDATVWVKE